LQLGSGVSLVGGVSIGFGLPVLHSGGGGKTVVHTSIVLVGHLGSLGIFVQSIAGFTNCVLAGGHEGSSGVLLQSTLEVGGLTGRSVCIGGGGGGFPSVEEG